MSGTYIYYSEDMNLYYKTTTDSDYVTINSDGSRDRLELGFRHPSHYREQLTQVDQESLAGRCRYPSTFAYYRRVRPLAEDVMAFRRPMRINWMNFRQHFELPAPSPFVYLTLYMNPITRTNRFHASRWYASNIRGRFGGVSNRHIRRGDFFIQKRPDEDLQGKNTLAFGCVCVPENSDHRQPEFIPLKIASNDGDISIVKASSRLPRYYDAEVAPHIED